LIAQPKGTSREPERGTDVKPTYMIAGLAAVFAVAVFVADASAMYDPTTGCFLQRDPGLDLLTMRVAPGGPVPLAHFIQRDPEPEGTAPLKPGESDVERGPTPPIHLAQYTDGMSLYGYARSVPVMYVDPEGLRSTACGTVMMPCKSGFAQWPVFGESDRAKWIVPGGQGCVTLLSPTKGIYCTFKCKDIQRVYTGPPGPSVPILDHEACHACAYQDGGLSSYLGTWIPGDLNGCCNYHSVPAATDW
jgi:hypothetical protein